MANPFRRLAKLSAATTGQRMYAAGAQFSRTTADWIRSAVSIDQEVRADIRVLRSRARTLVRDNEHARGVVRVLKRDIIGAQGIRPVPMNVGADGELSKKANAAIVKAWAEWSHPENASTDTRSAFSAIEGDIIGGIVTDGEAFIRIWDGFPNAFGFALELIDPDLLDEQFNRGPDQVGNSIRMGVEVDKYRRPLAYHFWMVHPSDAGFRNQRLRVPASEVIHLFRPLRPGQTRGISWFAPVLLNAKMLAGYTEAELVAARTAAAKMGFFVSKGEDGGITPGTGESIVMDASPGSLEQLPPGVEFQQWDPQHPSTAFDTFVTAILRAQAVGLGVSYATLTGDLTKANYSSARIGMLGERDEYELLQTWLAEHCHRRVYRAWLPIALLTDFLVLPSYDAQRWLAVRWQGRRWAWIDPLKDIQAVKEEISLGLNSRQNVARSQGRDFELILAELARENELAKAHEVDISGAVVTIKEAAPGNDSENDEGTDDPAAPAPTASAAAKPAPRITPKKKAGRFGDLTASSDADLLAALRDNGWRQDPAPEREAMIVNVHVESPKGTTTRRILATRANGEALAATITEETE
jgi:lambda family phage portal protein